MIKKSAIALAVASIVAAPVTANAAAHGDGSSFWASGRIGFEYIDPGDDLDTDLRVKGHAARFGAQGETALNNKGMMGYGKYEFSYSTEGTGAAVGRRHALVGLKGDFGKVYMGHTYHTYYNMVVSQMDPTWWNGCNRGCTSPGREGERVSYEGDFGVAKVGATLLLANGGEENLDGSEIGAMFDAGPVTIGVGSYDLETADDPTTAISATGNFGDFSVGGLVGSTGDDSHLSLLVQAFNAYLQIGTDSIDATDQDQTSTTLGYTLSIGPKTLWWFEVNIDDPDDGSDEDTKFHAVLRHDFN